MGECSALQTHATAAAQSPAPVAREKGAGRQWNHNQGGEMPTTPQSAGPPVTCCTWTRPSGTCWPLRQMRDMLQLDKHLPPPRTATTRPHSPWGSMAVTGRAIGTSPAGEAPPGSLASAATVALSLCLTTMVREENRATAMRPGGMAAAVVGAGAAFTFVAGTGGTAASAVGAGAAFTAAAVVGAGAAFMSVAGTGGTAAAAVGAGAAFMLSVAGPGAGLTSALTLMTSTRELSAQRGSTESDATFACIRSSGFSSSVRVLLLHRLGIISRNASETALHRTIMFIQMWGGPPRMDHDCPHKCGS